MDKYGWEGDGTSRIPFWVYTDEALYKKELERLFYKNHCCYIGLEAEVPNTGDFKRTVIGESSVVMTRDMDGHIHVVENVCASRHAILPRATWQQEGISVPIPPMELFAQG